MRSHGPLKNAFSIEGLLELNNPIVHCSRLSGSKNVAVSSSFGYMVKHNREQCF